MCVYISEAEDRVSKLLDINGGGQRAHSFQPSRNANVNAVFSEDNDTYVQALVTNRVSDKLDDRKFSEAIHRLCDLAARTAGLFSYR